MAFVAAPPASCSRWAALSAADATARSPARPPRREPRSSTALAAPSGAARSASSSFWGTRATFEAARPYAEVPVQPCQPCHVPPTVAPARIVCEVQATENADTLHKSADGRFIVRLASANDLDGIAEVRANAFFKEGDTETNAYFYKQTRDEFRDVVAQRMAQETIFILVAIDTRPAEEPAAAPEAGSVVVGTADVEMLPARKAALWDPESLPYRGYVSNMSVLFPYRRRGIGRLLLRGCEQIALEQGSDHMYLHVMEDNEGALKAYERSGFAVDKYEAGIARVLNQPRRIRMTKPASL